jgi:hypothetical protein
MYSMNTFHSAILLFVLVFGMGAGFDPITTQAASFTTNTLLDTSDASPGDGLCADAAGKCSLRAGIEETNALAGSDTLNVGAGTYLVGQTLVISDNLTLIGSGRSTTIITPVINANVVLRINTASSVSGFSIDGQNNCDNGILSYGVGVINTIADVSVAQCLIGLSTSQSTNSITNSQFNDNQIGIEALDSILTATNIEANNNRLGIKIVNISATPIARISNSRINNNFVPGNANELGGGMYISEGCFSSGNSVYLKNVEIDSNVAGKGAGIYNHCGHVVMENTTVSNNRAEVGAGLFSEYPIILPDIIFVQADPNAFVDIKNSTFSGNKAVDGGAIYQNSERLIPATVPYTLDILNTTFAQNQSTGSDITIRNGNLGGANSAPINVRIRNSLLVQTSESFCSLDPVVSYTGSNNMASDITCDLFPGMTVNAALTTFLGPLQNNGNSVKTHALLAGSSAINAASNIDCPTTDEALQPRSSDGTVCDIGAFEYQANTGTFSGKLFVDDNKNGIQDGGEESLSGVEVEILDGTGNIVLTVITNASGLFSGSLPAGNYTYQVNQKNLKNGLSNSVISTGNVSGSLNIVSGASTLLQPVGYVVSAESLGLIRTGGISPNSPTTIIQSMVACVLLLLIFLTTYQILSTNKVH